MPHEVMEEEVEEDVLEIENGSDQEEGLQRSLRRFIIKTTDNLGFAKEKRNINKMIDLLA